jgi:acyl-coenzyme A thioesterase PaaI-like protein
MSSTAHPAPVTLPWSSRDDHHCFGCAPGNPRGLKLEFQQVGGELWAEFALDRHYESYPGVVHGGILSLICDETMGNLLVLRLDQPALTTSLRMRYVGVVGLGRRYRCVARCTPTTTTSPIAASAEIVNDRGEMVATCTAHYQALGTNQPLRSIP